MFLPLIIEILYLYFSLKKPWRRYKTVRADFPKPWMDFVLKHSQFYKGLEPGEKERFEDNIKIFLSEFSIKGIRGQAVDMELKLLVAIGFATLLHGRPEWEPPLKDGILIYPGTTFDEDYRIGYGEYAGMARINSPLIVTEDIL